MTKTNKPLARTIGVLLHPTALPQSPVCGTFGTPARMWLEAISKNKIGVWQILPLAPPDGTGSPYSSPSSFALNPWFLDAEDLYEEGFISQQSLKDISSNLNRSKTSDSLDFKLAETRSKKLGQSLKAFWSIQSSKRHREFKSWCKKQVWLEDHVTFMELRSQNEGLPWWKWPKGLASHEQNALDNWKAHNQENLLAHRLLQWHLERQWQAIKKMAKKLGVKIFGDLPFYVARDSADVWSNQSLFSIDSIGNLEVQSGVPPDYFSSSGQLWGNPVYRWQLHHADNFQWWRKRFSRQWQLFDLLRLDHFRALDSYWAVPGTKTTAKEGHWKPSPGSELLELLKKDAGGNLPLVAEDLGVITPEVENLREKFNLPGMKILQFAFDGNQSNPYLPENIKGNRWVIYTGTHDNPTTLGWWKSLDNETKKRVAVRFECAINNPGWQLLELGLATEACLVVAPFQDLLKLGDEARFNKPGTVLKNWCWRLSEFDINVEQALKSYGERGTAWGRSFKSAASLLS